MRRRAAYVLMMVALTLGMETPARAADAPVTQDSPDHGGGNRTYTNPLNIQIPGDGKVESCADPTVLHGAQPGDHYWYMYCTTDPLNGDYHNLFRGLQLPPHPDDALP